MLLRKNTGWMDGFYCLPSGKSEWFESFTQSAVREAKEEAGVTIAEVDLKCIHMMHRHGESVVEKTFMDWVDVYFEAARWSGEPHNAEQQKSERLEWIDLDNLPENVVPPQKAA